MTNEVVITLAIILLAVSIYLGTYYIKKKHYNEIDEIDKEKKKIQTTLPVTKAEKLGKMSITGQSKILADQTVNKINDIEAAALPEIESFLFEAEEATDRYRFGQATDKQDKAKEALKLINETLEQTILTIDELLQREEANLKKIDSIKKRYHKLRKELLASSFSFGESIDSLEDKLGEIESDFTSFSDLTASGDHEEAKKVVNRLEKEMDEMEKLMSKIPEYHSIIKKDYLTQLEEINEGYETLRNQDYIFPESFDFNEEVNLLTNQIGELKESLKQLNLESADDMTALIEKQIDKLYDSMETEIEAKAETTKLLQQLRKIVLYLQNQDKELGFEIDRISQSYKLYQNEEQNYKKIQSSIAQVKSIVQAVEKNLSDNQLAYSDASQSLDTAFKQAEELSASLQSLSEKLQSYRSQEKEIKNDIDEMELALREMKRYVEGKHLPGLPKDYLQFFFYTTDHLEILAKELSRPKLDFEEVLSLHQMCEEDIEKLADRTDELVDHALLTELTSQRLYRHREEHPEVVETIRYSENLFLEDFDYDTSLKMVREKLESIEPGSYQEVLSQYQKDKTYN
ncbi:septation ring formation regulator EzrA [Alkalibacterium sp.]|nr:MAG: hypothetical protein EA249_02455 [Alkalibacterium sp.]